MIPRWGITYLINLSPRTFITYVFPRSFPTKYITKLRMKYQSDVISLYLIFRSPVFPRCFPGVSPLLIIIMKSKSVGRRPWSASQYTRHRFRVPSRPRPRWPMPRLRAPCMGQCPRTRRRGEASLAVRLRRVHQPRLSRQGSPTHAITPGTRTPVPSTLPGRIPRGFGRHALPLESTRDDLAPRVPVRTAPPNRNPTPSRF